MQNRPGKNHQNRRLTNIDKLLGQNLRRFRHSFGYTLQELAQKINISYSQISSYETARTRVSSSHLYKFSKIFNVSIDDFFKEIDNNINIVERIA